jgi:hypothetical protein
MGGDMTIIQDGSKTYFLFPFHSFNWSKSLQPSYIIDISPPPNSVKEASSSEIVGEKLIILCGIRAYKTIT